MFIYLSQDKMLITCFQVWILYLSTASFLLLGLILLQLVSIYFHRNESSLIKFIHLFLLILYRSQSYLLEGCFNSLSVFSTSRQMFDFWMLRLKLLNAGVLNLAVLFSIDFVSDQNKWELFWLLWRSLVQKLSDPRLNVLKGLHISCVTLLLVMS